jgi:hypothetical protein
MMHFIVHTVHEHVKHFHSYFYKKQCESCIIGSGWFITRHTGTFSALEHA